MRSSLSLCPLWALWVQQTRFWGSWQSSHSGTFRNRVKITGQVRVTRIQMQVSLVPGSQAHRGRFPLFSDPRGPLSTLLRPTGGHFPLCSDPRGVRFPLCLGRLGGLLPLRLRSPGGGVCFPLYSDPSSAAFMSLWRDFIDFLGFPGGSAVINLPAVLELWVPSLSREDPRQRKWQPTPLFLPVKPMDRGAWWATVDGLTKSQTRLSDETTTTLLSKPSVFYCSKLWKILITRKEHI